MYIPKKKNKYKLYKLLNAAMKMFVDSEVTAIFSLCSVYKSIVVNICEVS